jgi:hypothetical protein
MEPALVISAASALAFASAGASGAISPYGYPVQVDQAQVFRIVPPTIELSAIPVEIQPQLEAIIYSSMSHDFERRYAL